MRRAIDLVHYVVKDGIIHSGNDHVNDVHGSSVTGSNPSMSNRPKEVRSSKQTATCCQHQLDVKCPLRENTNQLCIWCKDDAVERVAMSITLRCSCARVYYAGDGKLVTENITLDAYMNRVKLHGEGTK